MPIISSSSTVNKTCTQRFRKSYTFRNKPKLLTPEKNIWKFEKIVRQWQQKITNSSPAFLPTLPQKNKNKKLPTNDPSWPGSPTVASLRSPFPDMVLAALRAHRGGSPPPRRCLATPCLSPCLRIRNKLGTWERSSWRTNELWQGEFFYEILLLGSIGKSQDQLVVLNMECQAVGKKKLSLQKKGKI